MFCKPGLPMRRMEFFFGGGVLIFDMIEVQSYCSLSSKTNCAVQIATFAAWIHRYTRQSNTPTTIEKKLPFNFTTAKSLNCCVVGQVRIYTFYFWHKFTSKWSSLWTLLVQLHMIDSNIFCKLPNWWIRLKNNCSLQFHKLCKYVQLSRLLFYIDVNHFQL